MRRASRCFAAVACLLFAGCTATSDVGSDALSPDDALWVGVYVCAFVLAVVGARYLLDNKD